MSKWRIVQVSVLGSIVALWIAMQTMQVQNQWSPMGPAALQTCFHAQRNSFLLGVATQVRPLMKWWLLQLLGAIHSCWVPRTKAAVSVAGGRPWIAAMSSRPLRTCAAACDAAWNTTLIKIACCPSFLVELFGCDPSALCEAVELDGASTYCPHQLHARHALRSLN